jgi:hypothetical protein
MKVGLYTSISPTHVLGDIQQQCARSWMDAGIDYTTVNACGEDITVPDGARAIDTTANARHLYGKPYIFIDDLLDIARADDVGIAIITNSDIELIGDITPYLSGDAVYIGNRLDHDGDTAKGSTYPHGFDLFIIPRKYIDLIPQTLFVLGQTWWDYYVPWVLMQANAPLRRVPDGTIAHRRHAMQYNTASWERMTEHFKYVAHDKAFRHMSPSGLTNHIFKLITKYAR